MTAIQPREPGLAGAVHAGAAGLYSLEAACDLVISAGWLHRDDFTCFVSTVTSITDGATELAHIDWQSVISSRDAGLLPCSSGENRILRLAASIPPASPSTSTTPSADSTRPASASSSAPSATPTGSVPPVMPAPDDMTCVTCKSGNRHTVCHHQRESTALESARQNRYTDPLHTASAERRHTYAQRHADAGVPIDVLAELLDHRNLNVTRCYYRVGEDRRREAVDKVTALSFDRHGNRIWRDAAALLESAHARYAVGEVAVPYGRCTEPSNVQAGGGACPVRFRCAGCDHFRTDVSYLPDLTAYLDDLLRTRERLSRRHRRRR